METNLNVLPFYSAVSKQNSKKWYAYKQVFPLITQSRFILPFQIKRPTTESQSLSVLLFDTTGTLISDITTGMLESGLKIVALDGYDLIVNPGRLPIIEQAFEGPYYIKISDSNSDWYSEIFTWSIDVSNCLKLVYFDNDDFDANEQVINYNVPFRNMVYIQSEVGKPDYEFEEDVIKRDGYEFIEKQISYKKYKFTFLAPEYLCDALRVVRMHDNIMLTDRYGNLYNIDSFLMTAKWDEVGYLAVVDVEFTCDTVIKKIGKARTISNIGDFNDDFNTDFDITTTTTTSS